MIPHENSSSLSSALAVNDPFSFSNAQKNNVSFGCPARWTGILPAKFRGEGPCDVGELLRLLGSLCVPMIVNIEDGMVGKGDERGKGGELTRLPSGAVVVCRFVWVYMGKGVWSAAATRPDVRKR